MLHWQLFEPRNVQRRNDDPGLLPVMLAKKQFYFGSWRAIQQETGLVNTNLGKI